MIRIWFVNSGIPFRTINKRKMVVARGAWYNSRCETRTKNKSKDPRRDEDENRWDKQMKGNFLKPYQFMPGNNDQTWKLYPEKDIQVEAPMKNTEKWKSWKR